MGRRKVSVELELEVARYARGGAEATAVSRTVRSAVHDLGDELDATSRDMDQLAANTDVAARQVDDLGDEARGTAADLALLQSSLDATKLKVRQLGAEFAGAGGDDGLLGLFGETAADPQTSRLHNALNEIERMRKELEKIDDLAAVKTVAPLAAGGGVGGLLNSVPRIGGIPGPAVAGIGAAAVVLSPFIGGIIASAVLGGVGTGGLIGGIALAAQDTRVKSAWKGLGQEVSANIGDAAFPLVGPLTRAASIFGDAWRKELPGVQQDFQILSATVEPLAEGIAGFARNLHPGLTTALKASVPLAERFSDDFTGLGTDLADFFRDIARSEPGAEAALHDFFEVLGIGLDGLGDGIEILSKTYEWANKLGMLEGPKWLFETPGLAINVWRTFNPELEKATNNLKNVLTPTEELAREQEDAADAAKRQADAMEKLNKRIDDYYDAISSRHSAARDWEAAWDDLHDIIKENGKTLDITTEKGRAVGEGLDRAAAAARGLLETGQITEQQYQDRIRLIETEAIKLGLSTSAVHRLLDEYLKIPSQIITELVVRAPGLQKAFDMVRYLAGGKPPTTPGEHSGGQIGSLIQAPAGSAGGGSRQAFLDLSGRAAGGPAYAGQFLRVNEQRLEAFVAPSQGYVLPLVAGAAASPMGGGGWDMTPVVHVYIGGERIDERVDVRVEMANRRAASDVYARPRL